MHRECHSDRYHSSILISLELKVLCAILYPFGTYIQLWSSLCIIIVEFLLMNII